MVIGDFNLLISTSRGNENNACSEAWFLLGELGDRTAQVEKTQILGLTVAKTALEPVKAIEGLRKILNERPEEFRYILRVIPIELVVHTSLDEIAKAVAELSPKILENEIFRITVEKRHSNLSTGEIIEATAAAIQRRVNLENPDRVILIEILGRITGVSIIKPTEILSAAKERTS